MEASKTKKKRQTIDGLAATSTVVTTNDSDSGHGGDGASASDEHDANSDQEDCFVDAEEEFAETNIDGDGDAAGAIAISIARRQMQEDARRIFGTDETRRLDLKVRLEETREILKLALNNEFARAIDLCSEKADSELYASLAHATLSFLRAALTLEASDLKAALVNISKSLGVSAGKRRPASTAQYVMRFLCRPNYNQYSDDEVHAELVHSESLLLMALISFLADQSLFCLVKGALRIRSCYTHYKECVYIMQSRKTWSSDEARKHFESGVRMGRGIFNLLMSYLPGRVLRFLEYVGFSGNRSVGVAELDTSVQLNDGLRSIFSSLVILTYHSYVENLFGLGDYDADKVAEINETSLGQFPNSAFLHLFQGRYHQMTGNLSAALEDYKACISSQSDWKQFHSLCHWEMMWCHAVQMNWLEAGHYADLLRRNSKWSPASYTYQHATFIYAKLVEDQRLREEKSSETGDSNNNSSSSNATISSDTVDEMKKLMKSVPELRIRYAGKTIPAEKFAITRSIKFLDQGDRLTLPALEFLYIWNVFATLKNNPIQVSKLLARINTEIEYLEEKQRKQQQQNDAKSIIRDNSSDNDSTPSSSTSTTTTTESQQQCDDMCLALLLKAMCLKHLDRLEEAENCLMQVIDSEESIKTDTFLLPHAAMEMSLLKLTTKNFEAAKEWIRTAKTNYSGYLLETIVHFRLHAASRAVRLAQHNSEDFSDSTSISTTNSTTIKDNNNAKDVLLSRSSSDLLI